MSRRRLGQHYLVDESVAEELVLRAGIRRGDRVVEIGAGRGALTLRLADVSTALVSYEIDAANADRTRALLDGRRNVELKVTDAFSEEPRFDVLVSSLPYSESARFVEWLAPKEYRTAAVILQDDFAAKISAPPGDRNYRGVSALAQMASDVSLGPRVGRGAFDPPPKVASRIVTLTHRRTVTRPQVDLVKKLFGLRRRTLAAAAKSLGIPLGVAGEERIFQLPPERVYRLVAEKAPG
jgi:16S rRNA A1518/A1519 N6-dimethyltransferase RsmA/KsgA/DIM1 with predicted DNA glycosylase/AP lyase activity